MSSESESRLHSATPSGQALPIDPLAQADANTEPAAVDQQLIESQPTETREAVADYRTGPGAIDNDTRLSSVGDTEAIWTGRPARVSVIRSLERAGARPTRAPENKLFRGDDATSHTRRDLLTGDWTIFAPKRDERPNEFAAGDTATKTSSPRKQADAGQSRHAAFEIQPGCPFCAGAEQQTPEAVWSAKLGDLAASDSDLSPARFARPQVQIKNGEQDGWDVRVVPNKFPAVSAMDGGSPTKSESQCLFPIAEVVGGHEVIVESGLHADSMTQFDPSLVYVTLMAYRDRIRYWRDIPGVNYISVFKNCGLEAGASLRHSHSQLIATSMMPEKTRTSLLRSQNHRARTGCSLGCDLLRAELAEKSRLIDRTDSFVAFCPFASRFAGTIRITSIAHQPHFEDFADSSLDQLASFFFRALSWIGEAYPDKAFNYLLHTCPPGSSQPEAFQWSLDIFPRLNKTAGFEWSCECLINSLLPEAAASRYREIACQNDPRRVLSLG